MDAHKAAPMASPPQVVSPTRADLLVAELQSPSRKALPRASVSLRRLSSTRPGDAGQNDSDADDGSLGSEPGSFRYEPSSALPATPLDAPESRKAPQRRAVLVLKIALGFFLVACAVVLSGFAYALLHTYQQTQFQDAFDAHVSSVRQGLASGYLVKREAGEVVAAHVAALAEALRLPPERSYEVTAAHASLAALDAPLNGMAVSRAFLYAPLVNASQLAAFNAFAATAVPAFEGAAAAATALAAYGVWSLPPGGTAAAAPSPPNASAPYYVPFLQLAPFAPAQAFVLLDALTLPAVREPVRAVLDSRTPQLTDMFELTEQSSVTSIMFTPVVLPASGAVAGVTGIVFSWADMAFTGLLQSGARGVVGEVRSPSGASQTFSVVGGGALREESANFTRDSAFDRYCVVLSGSFGDGWTVRLWPTSQLHDVYVTNTPIISAVVIAVLVLFVCIMFGIFDWYAASRAALLTRMWHATEAVVADVFPRAVKSRLVQLQLERHRPESGSSSVPGGRMRVRNSILSAVNNAFGREDASVAGGNAAGNAPDAAEASHAGFIADAYAGATVVFADIVGFTEWSASVPPTEVFRVLEAVFLEFDALAKQLGVFKVETIGDCYMACCGCPDAYEDHAARAADFALGLADGFARAGAATGVTHLRCRVGLHSGPVVAGVLRAEKHRFQLFGDTVNTASRMESTGEPERVQCSAATAALLQVHGRHTLTRRGVIAVKGKGSIETFWLTARRGRPRSMRGSDGGAAAAATAKTLAEFGGGAVRAPKAGASGAALAATQEEDAAARTSQSGGPGVLEVVAVTGDDSVRVVIDDVRIDTTPKAAAGAAAGAHTQQAAGQR